MNKYAARSLDTELIDEPGIPFAHWAECLKELDTVNTYLGGHKITVDGVQRLIKGKKSSVTIAEIGCGGGDNLKAIYRWSRANKIPASFIGIDINEACIDFAIENCSNIPGVKFITSDYRKIYFGEATPDIIFSSLFCHHFTNDQLVEMLVWLKQNTRRGFFINDLQRHPVAFHSIKWLTKLFSRSYLVRNDAPISVMRGFSRKEWETLLSEAGITKYSIQWKWAFRYLITVNND
jgi:ubiquinone/menaquinone biosynthesis C-methylase UbiE